MIERWLEEVAEQFWADAGGPEPFPRSLEPAVSMALPLVIVRLPRLWVSKVISWLTEQGVAFRQAGTDRPLHGCLVACRGAGFVFLDGTDGLAELRFSLAHEVAHFLLDYYRPRQQAVRRLGAGILAVLDGLRPPTVTERVHGLLSGVSLGLHTHLMERRPDGIMGCGHTAWAESQADRLGLELLAPASAVWNSFLQLPPTSPYAHRLEHIQRLLVRQFGLPPGMAASYGQYLVQAWTAGPSFRQWLGLG